MDGKKALIASSLRKEPVSVTRKMAAALPELRRLAAGKGLKIHHLGAGYPHPEVTDPRGFLEHKTLYFEHLTKTASDAKLGIIPEHLRESYAYTDTLGPVSVRKSFARVYGADWEFPMKPENLIPTIGASGGINLMCSLFERPGVEIAYITDAPTYAGFITRAQLANQTKIYSVDMDSEGPIIEQLIFQIESARSNGRLVPFYYTIPDGHNPGGFSFSAKRRNEIIEVMRNYDILILEDAPYVYISYAEETERPRPFVALDPSRTVHLFTGSKIGFPGPRVGFLYTEANIEISNEEIIPLRDLLLTESSSDILFHNPEALYAFESMLHDENMEPLPSLWPVAREKQIIYSENRNIIMQGLSDGLGKFPERYSWTIPQAGFFTVFRFHDSKIVTDDVFVNWLVSEYGIVVIPMFDFYPEDARLRNPQAGLSELRLSFCFSESFGDDRRRDLADSIKAFCDAILRI